MLCSTAEYVQQNENGGTSAKSGTHSPPRRCLSCGFSSKSWRRSPLFSQHFVDRRYPGPWSVQCRVVQMAGNTTDEKKRGFVVRSPPPLPFPTAVPYTIAPRSSTKRPRATTSAAPVLCLLLQAVIPADGYHTILSDEDGADPWMYSCSSPNWSSLHERRLSPTNTEERGHHHRPGVPRCDLSPSPRSS